MDRPYVSKALREIVYSRANGCCEYCRNQADYSSDTFAVEHIHPAAKGGDTISDNLALSCHGCNSFKHVHTEAIDPITEQISPLYNPRSELWNDHFAWSGDFTPVIGLTPTGRATVQTLRLNHRGLQNIRKVLYAAGKHPPM